MSRHKGSHRAPTLPCPHKDKQNTAIDPASALGRGERWMLNRLQIDWQSGYLQPERIRRELDTFNWKVHIWEKSSRFFVCLFV